eukprot:TRINITY_DN2900_c0_g1_i5.p1 TRINITY_DN2900_c0_g1~~TRINITY_DN2900_c0_g1_i5.p1  ORF type:complete len:155 (+),score=23.33 TRINITY_DN2900_c0_g1_i5:359-823(+)
MARRDRQEGSPVPYVASKRRATWRCMVPTLRKEVMKSTPSGSYMGPWQLHAVASILHTTIQTLYPEYGDHAFRQHMQRLIGPRLPSSGSDSRASKPPCIMWSRVWGKDVPKEVWEPNHFVVCLPESETDRNQQLKRKSGQSQIHAFFSKKPRSQ